MDNTATSTSEQVPFRADSNASGAEIAEVQPGGNSTDQAEEIGTPAEVTTPSTGDPNKLSVSFPSPSNPLSVEDENANGSSLSAVTQEPQDDSISTIAQQQPRSPTPDFSQALRNSAPQAPTSDNEVVSGEERDQVLVHSESAAGDVAETPGNKEEKEPVSNGEDEEEEEEDDYEPPAPMSPQNVTVDSDASVSQPQSGNDKQSSSQNNYTPVDDFPGSYNNVPSDTPSVNPLTNPESSQNARDSIDVTSPSTLAAPPEASTPAVISPTDRHPLHNRIDILEKRVQSDPIGDGEAWLELIEEYRSLHKLDDARETFNRFFKYFPAAVCFPSFIGVVSVNHRS